MVHKFLMVPLSPTNDDCAFKMIKHTSVANDYKGGLVDKLINKHENKKKSKTITVRRKSTCVLSIPIHLSIV